MLKLDEIIQATQGDLLNPGQKSVFKSLSINSRTVKPGAVFVAIKGKRFDGHAFVPQAVKQGATAIIVSQLVKVKKSVTVIKVKDTTRALGLIAAVYRSRFNIPIIAITGSAGKTSTKELIAAVLKDKYKVLKNEKTENNQFGVPLTLLKLKNAHDVAVIELGTNCPGDIAWLSQIVKPTVALFTNIGESHLEKLKSKQGVFTEKKQILKSLSKDGVIILNADDPYLKRIQSQRSSQKILSYSINTPSNYQAKKVKFDSKGKMDFFVHRTKVTLNALASHNIYNALAAICCGRLFKISYNNINTILNKQKNKEGRQKVFRIGKICLIDDTYNSNPVSLKSAINSLDMLMPKKGGSKILICADMLELGKFSKNLHERVAPFILKSSIDYVITLGKNSKWITKKILNSRTRIKAYHSERFEDIYKRLKKIVSQQDIILVKGSRSMHMEKVVQFIKNHY